MDSFDLVDFVAVAVMVGGLAVVLGEILVRSPRSLLEIMADSRRFAEPRRVAEEAPAAPRSVEDEEAVVEHPRLAA